MFASVRDDTRALTRLYDQTLTAINPPNVFYRTELRLQEPFQPSSMYPIGEPPVRYPDLTTVPGFLDNPAQDETDLRHLLVRNAQRVSENVTYEEPFGRAPVGFESFGKLDFQKDKTGTLPGREAVQRIIYPYEPLRGTYPMTGWD
jgi:hypothetical protein